MTLCLLLTSPTPLRSVAVVAPRFSRSPNKGEAAPMPDAARKANPSIERKDKMANEVSVAASSAEVLRRSAQYMNQHGQCKGSLSDDDGSVCLVGALVGARTELRGEGREVESLSAFFRLLARSFREFAGDPTGGYVSWNDDPTTSQTEVEKFLLFAADRVEFGDAS